MTRGRTPTGFTTRTALAPLLVRCSHSRSAGPPGSRASCFRACMRSQTAQGPGPPRQSGVPSVAFDMASMPRHPRLKLFRGSIFSLPVPLSTLRLHRYRRLRMTRGRCGWLNLQRMSPSDTTTRQSPGARRLTIRSTGPIAACRHLGYKSLAQMPARRNGPFSSNYKGFPVCQAAKCLNLSRSDKFRGSCLVF